MSDEVTKHHSLATTGKVPGYKHGGHVDMHKHHDKKHHGGHKEMEHHERGKVEHHASGGGCGTAGGSRSKY